MTAAPKAWFTGGNAVSYAAPTLPRLPGGNSDSAQTSERRTGGSDKNVTALSLLRSLGDAGRVQADRTRSDGVELASLSNAGFWALRGNRIAMIFQEPMSSLNRF